MIIMTLFATYLISFVPYTVHITSTVHRTAISINHLAIACAGFFRYAG